MSGNSSSFSNDSYLHPNVSIININLPFPICFFKGLSSLIYAAFYIINILLFLPLCISILYAGLKQWRRKRSSSGTSTISHNDSIVLNLAIFHLVGTLGFVFCCCGVFGANVSTYWVGYCLWTFTWYGEIYMHNLACVDRYLAVIHPIIYRSLRSTRGIRIRNVSIGSAWLFSCTMTSLLIVENDTSTVDISFLSYSVFAISFCSLSVLCALIHPGPGQSGGNRGRVDQSKKKAFHTIMALLAVLLLRFFWNLVWYVAVLSDDRCIVLASGVWFSLPSNLMLPLLFLQKVGMFAIRKNIK